MTHAELIARIARHFGLSVAALTSKSRRRDIVEARQVAAWALRTVFPTISLGTTGQLLGGQDHTTIIYSVQKTQARLDADPAFARLLRELAELPPTRPRRSADDPIWWDVRIVRSA